MENRTKHYFQKLFVHKLVGKKVYSKIKFLKIYFKVKLGSNYEISGILLDILKKEDVFFDVGANLGQYLIRIKRKYKSGVRIFAFEPVLNNYNILSEYILKKYKNVTIENCAISDVEGVDVLYIPLINEIEIDTQASINHENRIKYYNEFIMQEVQTITIDNYVLAKDILKIDYLKIDTEGNDERVIKGALKSICKYKPVIFCEDMDSKETIDILFNLSYKRFILTKDYKLVNFSEAKPDNVLNDLVIFIPQEKLNIFIKYLVN